MRRLAQCFGFYFPFPFWIRVDNGYHATRQTNLQQLTPAPPDWVVFLIKEEFCVSGLNFKFSHPWRILSPTWMCKDIPSRTFWCKKGCILVKMHSSLLAASKGNWFQLQRSQPARAHRPTLCAYYHQPARLSAYFHLSRPARKVKSDKAKQETANGSNGAKRQWNETSSMALGVCIWYLSMTYVVRSCSKCWGRIESHYEYTWALSASFPHTHVYMVSAIVKFLAR